MSAFAVREDLERNNTMRMAAWEAQRAEFMLSMGKFAEADEHFQRSGVLLQLLERADLPSAPLGRKRGTLVGGEFVKAFNV